MKLIFDDPTFSLQLLRAISQTYYKGADIGECLSTAYRIKESDFESWYNEWYKTAKRLHYYAKECLKLGHKKVQKRHTFARQTITGLLSFLLLIQMMFAVFKRGD